MTVHVRLREWQASGPQDNPELRGLDLGNGTSRELAARLAKAGVVEITELRDGVRVQAFAHVGRIQLGEVLVTIEPKIGASDLLQLVRYAYGLRDLRLFEQTAFAHTGSLLQDLLAAQLHAEVVELLSRGLARRYVQRTEDLASPRGRIEIAMMARRAEPTSGRLPCRHHLRSADHTLNEVITGGVELAARVSQDVGIRRSLRRLAARLQLEIRPVALSTDSLARAGRQVNRLTRAYVPALRLTELLYACAAVSLDGEATTSLPGFLFDMNRFFQSLVGRFLSDHLPDFVVEDEHALMAMMRYLPGLNPRRRRSPTPRPDFVVKKAGAVVRILDAKYRDLWERELPRDMLYQLAIYSLSQPRPATATILFPTVGRDATSAVVEIRDPVGTGALGYVELRPIVIRDLVEALAAPRVQREALAHRLAFGEADVRTRYSA